jgi:GNAT superfamily N-acetyltransferase
MITIRKAAQKDCPRIFELIKELAQYEKAPDEVTVSLNHFEESGFGSHPVWWAFVAEANQTIIGFALYYIRYSTWKGQRMYLEDLYITESERRKGVGSLLMKALIQEARYLNLNGINWQVLEWNKPAIDFYKGYETTLDAEWINCTLSLEK